MTCQPSPNQKSKAHRPTPPAPRTFTVDEIAEYCGVTLADVHAWIHNGALKVESVGRRCKITRREFRDFVERMGIPVDESVFDDRR